MKKTANPHQPPLLTISDLTIDFATARGALHAVHALNLSLRSGELLALVGESGSGKSVTAQSIASILPRNARIRSGSIQFNGHELIDAPQELLQQVRGGEIGMVFQEPSLTFDPLYTIGKALHEAITAHAPHINAREARHRAISLLREIHLPNPEQRLKNYPHQFSGGQLQRISVALALAADPLLLIADEPTTSLDVTIQAEIIALLTDIRRARGLAVLFISHDISLVAQIADRIAVLYNGYLLEHGPTDALIARPRHPYTRALIGSIIPAGARYDTQQLTSIRGQPPDPYLIPTGCPFYERCDYAEPACASALPPVLHEESDHRCIIPGVKMEPAPDA